MSIAPPSSRLPVGVAVHAVAVPLPEAVFGAPRRRLRLCLAAPKNRKDAERRDDGAPSAVRLDGLKSVFFLVLLGDAMHSVFFLVLLGDGLNSASF